MLALDVGESRFPGVIGDCEVDVWAGKTHVYGATLSLPTFGKRRKKHKIDGELRLNLAKEQLEDVRVEACMERRVCAECSDR